MLSYLNYIIYINELFNISREQIILGAGETTFIFVKNVMELTLINKLLSIKPSVFYFEAEFKIFFSI